MSSESKLKLILGCSALAMISSLYAVVDPGFFLSLPFDDQLLEIAVFRLFFIHWCVLVASLGGLLVWACFRPALRPSVLLVAGFEKLVLILLIAQHWQQPSFAKLHTALIVDSLSLVFFAYSFWLIKQTQTNPASGKP